MLYTEKGVGHFTLNKYRCSNFWLKSLYICKCPTPVL